MRCLERLDMKGMAELYDVGGVIEAMREKWVGRSEIEDGLTAHGRQLRKFSLEGVVEVVESEGRLLFETSVRGPFGSRRVRHEWLLGDGGIQHHTMAMA